MQINGFTSSSWPVPLGCPGTPHPRLQHSILLYPLARAGVQLRSQLRGMRKAISPIELVAPGEFPVEWDHWPAAVRDTFPRCGSRQLDVGQDRLTGTPHAGTLLLYTAAARSRPARFSN
jgi:hypothetical protein